MATYTPVSEDENNEDEVVQETPLMSSRSLGASAALPIVNMPALVINGVVYPATLATMIQGVVPVNKGGTGLTELDGGRLLASNVDGTLFEEVDVDVQNLSGLTGNIQTQLNTLAEGPRTLVAMIQADATWTENPSGDGYMLTIPVTGIKSSDNPVVGLVSSATTSAGLIAEREAFGCIDDIKTNNGSITLICFDETPTTTFSISLHCTGV